MQKFKIVGKPLLGEKSCCPPRKDDLEGEGEIPPICFAKNLLVRVKLGHPPNFNFLGKSLLGEKYVEGRRKRRKRKKKKNNAKFSGTTSALARKLCVSTHYFRTKRRKNNAKFSGTTLAPICYANQFVKCFRIWFQYDKYIHNFTQPNYYIEKELFSQKIA